MNPDDEMNCVIVSTKLKLWKMIGGMFNLEFIGRRNEEIRPDVQITGDCERKVIFCKRPQMKTRPTSTPRAWRDSRFLYFNWGNWSWKEEDITMRKFRWNTIMRTLSQILWWRIMYGLTRVKLWLRQLKKWAKSLARLGLICCSQKTIYPSAYVQSKWDQADFHSISLRAISSWAN